MSTRRLKEFAVTLSLAAGLSAAGCGAMEELDKSAALLDKPRAADKAKAEALGEAPNPKRLTWDNVKSLNTSDMDASIIRCSLDGSVTFTRSDDCLAQGGTPAKI